MVPIPLTSPSLSSIVATSIFPYQGIPNWSTIIDALSSGWIHLSMSVVFLPNGANHQYLTFYPSTPDQPNLVKNL